MTFLQFACKQVLGPPDSVSYGQSYWPCPRCDHKSFSTLPHKAGYKDRFKCHRCGFLGDEYDLLREQYPTSQYPWQRFQVERLRKSYEQANTMPTTTATAKPNATRHTPSSPADNPKPAVDPRNIEKAFAELLERQELNLDDGRDPGLWGLVNAADLAGKYGIPLEDFAVNVATYLLWVRKNEREHKARCQEKHCEAVVCRKKRGLPPLKAKQIKDGKQARAEAKALKKAKVRKAIKPHAVMGGRKAAKSK